ncbi:MAG: HAMP domain-containing histidine kinase [Candidatus Eremiobacteraeota bacterium]|nr:HAMP domain-containing histidine kinase [Candidatus Eremiobacteraeota bacterium]
MIGALSVLAYLLIAAGYRTALGPALDVPEGAVALASALRRVLFSILAVDGGLALLVGVASFALARAAVQPLVEARAREARFAADAAHELRTPLGVIASVAQAARGDAERQEAALKTVSDQALEASALIADLLTLARHPEGRALAREPVDLAGIAAQTLREREPVAQKRGVTLELHAESAIVDGDERRLAQLVRNLVDNALRYARTHIDVFVDADGKTARIAVSDDGPGVSGELRAQVFERFAKDSTSDGSGLGLAICRWVARSHGGDITLEDGSTFVSRFPLGNYPTA